MKVHKITLLVVEDMDAEDVIAVLEDAPYPNRCIAPRAMATETCEVAWSDEHPLNKRATMRSAYETLFAAPSPDPALAAACDALGAIMHALNSRQLLAKGCRNEVIRAKMETDALPDAALLTMAGNAFEAAALELGRRGDPSVTVFSCNPTEGA